MLHSLLYIFIIEILYANMIPKVVMKLNKNIFIASLACFIDHLFLYWKLENIIFIAY